MADISEQQTWEPVYQREVTDSVLAGPNGIANAPIKNLVNRTAWLKQQIESLVIADIDTLQTVLDGLEQDIADAIAGGLSSSDVTTLIEEKILDSLTSTLTNTALSANQGRILKGLIDNIQWSSISGKPATFTPSSHDHSRYVRDLGEGTESDLSKLVTDIYMGITNYSSVTLPVTDRPSGLGSDDEFKIMVTGWGAGNLTYGTQIISAIYEHAQWTRDFVFSTTFTGTGKYHIDAGNGFWFSDWLEVPLDGHSHGNQYEFDSGWIAFNTDTTTTVNHSLGFEPLKANLLVKYNSGGQDYIEQAEAGAYSGSEGNWGGTMFDDININNFKVISQYAVTLNRPPEPSGFFRIVL